MMALELEVKGQTIINIKNLSKEFGNVKALRSVSLDIEQGEVVAFVGDNGDMILLK